MIHGFKEHYLEEAAAETVVVNFGRFNPPTNGHEKLLDASKKVAKGVHRVYASQSQDKRKNPLGFTDKVKFMRKMFPKHARSIIIDKSVRTFFDALVIAHKDGFKNCVVVVGSDRVNDFNTVLNKYNGVEAKHGFYEFANGVQVVSAGERDPDTDDVSGMSASKLRAAAKDNDLIAFTKGMPKGFKGAEALMNAVRGGMGLKEDTNYSKDLKLKRLSMVREKYINGNLFEVGDVVVIAETREKATINKLRNNYVEVNLNGESKNVWITDICKE